MNSFTSKSKPISQFLFSKSPSSSSSRSRILFISLFNTQSSSSSNSYQNYSPSSSPSPSRRQDEESKNVRVSVWWDIENCQVPNGVNVFKLTHLITSAVRANGIKGPVQVNAFGDVICLSRANQEALSSTGVNLVHIPRGGKNSADRSLLVDLMYWVSQNPPPAHIFLISGDRDFAGILHKLRMNNYNILLAGDGKRTPGVLCSAASIMWHWNELTKGENLSGRHYNQPPDGPFNSWYGHYRGPLEDPYAEAQSSSVADVSTSAEQSSEPSRHPVPLAILRQIRRIVSAHSNGLNITELRSELAKNNVPLDKNFYGYKKFSSFLKSMPNIIAVDTDCADGQFFLRPASRRGQKPAEGCNASVGSMSEKTNQDAEVARTANAQSNTITRMVDVESQLPVSTHVDHSLRTVEKKTEKTPENRASDASQTENQAVLTKGLPGNEASNEEVVQTPVAPNEEQNSKSDGSLLKRLCSNLFGSRVDRKKASYDIPDKLDMSIGKPEMSSPKEEEVKATSQYGNQHPETLSSNNAVIGDDAQQPANPSNTALGEDAKGKISDKTEASPGFITRVISWCKSWRNSSVITTTEQSSDEPTFIEGKLRKLDDASSSWKLDDASSSWKLDDASSLRKLNDASYSTKHELFSKDTFWSALQAFFKTRRGSDIVINSTSREQFAEKLQKEGPSILRPLQESDLHHLVLLLVSEKKWIVEFPTKTPRFRFAQPLVESSVETQPQSVQPHSSAGLSYIFMNSSSEGNHQSRVSSNVHKKPSEKSRSEVLADCQKLLDELTSQYPEGFNMGCFKRLFLEKYGYSLDHQKLGYPKLVSLLQIMPGVKVESTHVYSDKVVYSPGIESLGLVENSSGSIGNVFDSPQKNEDGESPWEELGPVAKQEKQSTIGQVYGDYEPSVSDDDEFSELEEDATPSSVKEDENRSRTNEEDSSLLQILDSWYSTKDESNPQDHGSHAEGLVDCSKKESESPQSSDSDGEGEVASASPATSAANHAWKQRPQKSYLFVSDPIETKKDKLIDGILGSLKKSGESRMQG